MPASSASVSSASTPVAEVTQQCVPAWDVFVDDMMKSVSSEVKAEARRGGQRTCMGLMSIHSKDKPWNESPQRGGINRKDYTVNQINSGLAELGLPHHEVSELTVQTPRGLGEFKHYTAVLAWGPIGNAVPPGNGQAERDGLVRNTAESVGSTLRQGLSHQRRRRPSSAPARRREATATQKAIAKGLSKYDTHLDARLRALETAHSVTSSQRSSQRTDRRVQERRVQEQRPASAPSTSENYSTEATVGRIQSTPSFAQVGEESLSEARVSEPPEQAHMPAGLKPSAPQAHQAPKPKRATSVPSHSAARANVRKTRAGRPSHTPQSVRRMMSAAAKEHADQFAAKSTQAAMSRTKFSTHLDHQREFVSSLRSSLEAMGRTQNAKTRKANSMMPAGKMQQKPSLGLSNVSTSASTLSLQGQGLGRG